MIRKTATRCLLHCGSPDIMSSFKIISRTRSKDPKILTGTTLERWTIEIVLFLILHGL